MKRFLLTFIIIAFVLAKVYPQCAGNRGTPVVNMDFGTGTSRVSVSAFPGYSTNMTFDSGCPDDGHYHISNLVPNCFGTWLSNARDHTGNTNGRMFIANAFDKTAQTSNTFFEYVVTGLPAGQAYDFSAWITSIVKNDGNHIPSNVRFVIRDNTPGNTNTTPLMQFNTGVIPPLNRNATSLSWNKYGSGIVIPNGVTSIKLVMYNDLIGGYGNDLAIDDIQLIPIGPCISITGSCNDNKLTATSALTPVTDYNPYQSGNQSFNYATPAYQWQTSANGTTWTNVSGATTATYAPASTPADGTYIRLLVAGNSTNLTNPNARIISNSYIVDGCNLIATPVLFGNINAKISEGNLIINWATLTESNNHHFNIEASKNGKEFVKIGEINSKAVNGNSSRELSYEYTTPLQSHAVLWGLSLVVIGLFGSLCRRRKTITYLLIASGILIFGISCSKSEMPVDTPDVEKVFVRIIQVDIDGKSESSKIITAYKTTP